MMDYIGILHPDTVTQLKRPYVHDKKRLGRILRKTQEFLPSEVPLGVSDGKLRRMGFKWHKSVNKWSRWQGDIGVMAGIRWVWKESE